MTARSVKKMQKAEVKENEDILDLKNMFQAMLTEIREMRQEQKEIKQEQRNFLEEMKNTNTELKMLREENKKLKERLDIVEKNMEHSDKAQRKNNIIIKGVDFNNDNKKFEKFCKDRLGTQVTAESISSINTRKNEKLSRIRFKNWEEKEMIMKNKNKLKGSQIFVDHDLTKAESEIQKILRDKVKEEKERGNTAKVGYQKIFINGECYVWNQRKKQLEKKGN